MDASVHETSGSLVFFDFLGAFVVSWPQYIASTVNIASIIIAGYSIHLNMQSARRSKNIYINNYYLINIRINIRITNYYLIYLYIIITYMYTYIII